VNFSHNPKFEILGCDMMCHLISFSVYALLFL
jgi:hypothetical protein